MRTHVGRIRRAGAVTDQGIVDLNFAYARLAGSQELADVLVPASVRKLLTAGGLDKARQCLDAEGRGLNDETLLYAPGEVRLLAPIPDPSSVRDFFAFEAHVKKGFEKRGEPMPAEWYEIPVYYKSGHHNILGTGEDVLWPSFTEKFDYELELAAVIGRAGKNVAAGEARGYIAGFTVMNDFSARDIQRREMKVRLGPSKGKDWATALGPVIVTLDEIGDPYSLEMIARVNGEEWSRGNSSTIHHSFEKMIEFLTLDDQMLPGDVLGSGTVGTGCGLELDRWVKPGDVIELEIERIGILRNRVYRAGGNA